MEKIVFEAQEGFSPSEEGLRVPKEPLEIKNLFMEMYADRVGELVGHETAEKLVLDAESVWDEAVGTPAEVWPYVAMTIEPEFVAERYPELSEADCIQVARDGAMNYWTGNRITDEIDGQIDAEVEGLRESRKEETELDLVNDSLASQKEGLDAVRDSAGMGSPDLGMGLSRPVDEDRPER